MNIDLKVELIRRFGSQVVAAKQLKIGESKLSYLVRGHVEPNPHEREILQNRFGRRLLRTARTASGMNYFVRANPKKESRMCATKRHAAQNRGTTNDQP